VPYVIITKDKPDALALRNEVRPAHIDYLVANQHRLLSAGAQIEDDGSGGSGGVIIVDTDDRTEAEDFIANDPFTKAGLFEDIQVRRRRKAFFNFERHGIRSPRARAMRALMVNAAIVVASLILGGAAMELALRAFATKYELAAEMPIERDSLRITSRPGGARRVVHHPDTGRPHQVVYNDRGMRQHRNFGEAELKSCTNIAFFGDSFVENVRLPAPYSFTEPLDFLLNRGGRCFNVLNFGQDGYATDQALIAYQYADIKDELDYVFYVFCDNDLEGIYANQLFKLDADGHLVRNPAMRTPWWIEAVSHWYITYLIIDGYRTLFPKKNAWEGINARTLQEKYLDKEVHQRARSQRAETIRKDWANGSTNEDIARALV